MTATRDLVRFGFTHPRALPALPLRDWDMLIRQARSAAVLGRLNALLEQEGLLPDIPAAARNHLESARLISESQERVIRWEVHCIRRALLQAEPDFVLLKGAAYVFSGLSLARGRLPSDVDILVPESKLAPVEAALLAHGWIHVKVDPYDQNYYRQWSHELPPFYHPERATVLDVHHNLLPRTGRLHPDPEQLLMKAEPIPGTPYRRLAPVDMVLHASAHMFQDELQQGLRELTDIGGLLREFSGTAGFWDALLQRAPRMQLQRPLFYALRYTREFLMTPIPDTVISQSAVWAPPGPLLWTMDKLVKRAFIPRHSTTATFATRSARLLLYIRSHWLRMPAPMLARHLLHQALRRH